MVKSCTSILSFLVFTALMFRAVSAQTFQNGSFGTGDFTGWQVEGGTSGTISPTVFPPGNPGAPATSPNGGDQALINSTGASATGYYAGTNAVPAATLNTFLDTTLPSNVNGSPFNGEAIQQTFSTVAGGTISFSYSYQSREAPGNGYDETGYVLNGVFHILADTNTPNQTMAAAAGGFFVWGIPYQTVSIAVGPGVNTLSFVTYNTGNGNSPTGLFIDNVVVTPVVPATYTGVEPSGSTDTQATGVSGNNVTGWFIDGGGMRHGFFFDGTNYTTIDPSGSTDTQATGVSGANVAGWYRDAGGVQHGFFFDGTNYTTVDPAGSTDTQATGVSGTNVVGWYIDGVGVQHGFIFDGTNYTTIDPSGSTDTQATGVSGTNVVGWFIDGGGVQHGFFFDGTNYATIDPSGSTDTQATGVSGTNVVGWYNDAGGVQHGFFFDGTNYTTIDPSGSTDTQVTGVSGTNVVGWYIDGGGVQHGFFFDGTNYTTVDPSGTTDTQATGVSGRNTVGWYNDAGGVQHGFLAAISKSEAALTVDNLFPTYDNTPKPVTVATVPANLNVTVTYDGSTTAPTLPGNYAVVATINNANYQGTATATLAINKATATVFLDNLTATYDGTPQSATATTNPTGHPVDITYNGSPTAPTAAGSYNVTGMIDDPIYQGVAHGTLVISQATASVMLSNLTPTYDGTAKSATVTTSPVSNLNVTVTYNGSTTPPTAAGSYPVVATVNDPNYQGLANGTLVIGQATAGVMLSDLTPTYDGTAKSVTVTTTPVSNLNVTVTYNGSTTPPTTAGSYPVVATVNDPNYQGMANGMLVIGQATATVMLSNLTPTYDGTAKSVTVTTTPVSNLNVTVTYNGSTTPPTTAGSYPVVATVNDTNYQGMANGTLVIGQATATVMLSNLAATYDGTPKSVTVTTSPVSNLNVTVTYGGSSTPPTAVGSYAVVATVNDTNYMGSAMGTLVISAATSSQTYSDWANSFSFAGGPTETTENDGIPNLFKYLYDINPSRPMTAADIAALPVLGVTTVTGVDYVTLTYRQYAFETGITIQVQTSSDLQTWTTVQPPDLSRQVGTDPITMDPIMEVGVRANGLKKQFIRLNVSQP